MNVGRMTVAAISSLVMRGAVGLRAIGFALERRGHTVWPVPTVVMPWHPGFGPSTRTPAAALAKQLAELGQHAGALDAVLTGYFASADDVAAAATFLDTVRAARPDALFVVDPVTGDEGGRYVPDAVAEAIHSRLVPRADIITPNINELQDLTGSRDPGAARALAVPQVIVTSAVSRPDAIGAALVTAEGGGEVVHPRLETVARGTGDLFSGVLTAALVEGMDALDALAEASAATYGVAARSGPDTLDLAGCQALIATPDRSVVRVTPTPR